MWMESMKSVKCEEEHITYDDFLLLMKGQTRESDPPPACAPVNRVISLGPVPEGAQINETGEDTIELSVKDEERVPSLSDHLDNEHPNFLDGKNSDDISMYSLPNTPGSMGMFNSSTSSLGLSDSSLGSPDLKQIISDIPLNDKSVVPNMSTMPSMLGRRRSQSLAEEKEKYDYGDFVAKNKSALTTVNRQLYRTQRSMRLSVIEASRRFEEEKARRARDTLIAQKLSQAGLVMRHGHKVQVTSETIRKYLKENKAEQEVLVEKANRRGGRGRYARKKTISDLNAMLNPSLGQHEIGVSFQSMTPDISKRLRDVSSEELIPIPDLRSKSFEQEESVHAFHGNNRANVPATKSKQNSSEVPSLELIDKAIRKATVPGVFRESLDPFGSDGMYGGSRISGIDVNALRDSASKRQKGDISATDANALRDNRNHLQFEMNAETRIESC
jgi:hypothetical protein